MWLGSVLIYLRHLILYTAWVSVDIPKTFEFVCGLGQCYRQHHGYTMRYCQMSVDTSQQTRHLMVCARSAQFSRWTSCLVPSCFQHMPQTSNGPLTHNLTIVCISCCSSVSYRPVVWGLLHVVGPYQCLMPAGQRHASVAWDGVIEMW